MERRAPRRPVRARPALRSSRNRRQPAHPDIGKWAPRWSMISGVAILLGLLLPLPDTRSFKGEWRFFWQDLDHSSIWVVLSVPLLLGLAVLALLAFRKLRGPSVGQVLVYATLAGLAIHILAWANRAEVVERIWPAWIVVSLGGALVGAGNHLRKRLPGAGAPSLVAGIGGIVLLVGFAIPDAEGDPLGSLLFTMRTWKHLPGVGVCLLLVVVYGILGVVSFNRSFGRDFTLALSLIVRAILALVPFICAFNYSMHGASFGETLVQGMNFLLPLYGTLALTALGLTVWIHGGQTQPEAES